MTSVVLSRWTLREPAKVLTSVMLLLRIAPTITNAINNTMAIIPKIKILEEKILPMPEFLVGRVVAEI